jgi:hypothetical protein
MTSTMTMTTVPDTSDTERAARFVRETEPLFDVLMRGARRLARNDAAAEDLLQDALLHAYSGFHTFREGGNRRVVGHPHGHRHVAGGPWPATAARCPGSPRQRPERFRRGRPGCGLKGELHGTDQRGPAPPSEAV